MKAYIKGRESDFKKITTALKKDLKYQSNNALVVYGDSLELIKRVPDQSVSLILTDPPYHSTKKENIKNDTAFKNDDEFLNWMEQYSKEWKRILKPNGSIYVYCSSAMAAKIEVMMSKSFNILSNLIWTKPNEPGFDGWKQKMNKSALRQWYSHSERIIFAEPSVEGNLKKSWFGNYLKTQRLKAGLSGHRLTELTGAYGKVNHGGAVSNWEAGRNVPSYEQYEKICLALMSTGKIEFMPPYEEVIRPFQVDSSIEFTDVWNFNSVRPYKGKHPAEKPLDMLEHSILSSSYEGDIVLDCFAGSGSTAIAALNTGRKTISIELDEIWVEAISRRIKEYNPENQKRVSKKHDVMKIKKIKLNKVEEALPLFT